MGYDASVAGGIARAEFTAGIAAASDPLSTVRDRRAEARGVVRIHTLGGTIPAHSGSCRSRLAVRGRRIYGNRCTPRRCRYIS
jgi:hypothetical protein